LYYFEEMSYREIADVIHLPISTIGIRLQRGKLMLKKIIEEEHPGKQENIFRKN